MENKWISVKDRFPEEEEDVLSYQFNGEINISYTYGHEWRSLESGFRMDNSVVTHWMPLPEPPTQ